MVLDPIPQSLPVHFFGSRPQPPTSPKSTCTSVGHLWDFIADAREEWPIKRTYKRGRQKRPTDEWRQIVSCTSVGRLWKFIVDSREDKRRGKISIKETYKRDPLTMKTNRRALVLGASRNLLWIPERTNIQKISIKETYTRDLLTV